MKERFDLLMNEYVSDDSITIDSNKNYYKGFVKELPTYLYEYFDSNKYLIKASIGVGQRSEIPWLCIFNRTVTTSATKGMYICFLFRKDMSGFYLELGQGITTFEELFGKDQYKNIEKVANYFRNLITDNKFSRDSIDLKGSNKLAKGYEYGTIISKYYDKNNYSENELLKDLIDLKNIYDDICENLVDDSYMSIVSNVVQSMDPSYIIAEEASRIIEKAILEEEKLDEAEIITLERVDIPKYKQKNKYSKIKKKTIKKIDYLKKAKSNAKNGLLGEELVMTYEQNRLIEIGREDLAEKIRWVSKEDDSIGYDIISFDVDKDNNAKEKYIEVKTTEGNDTNVFYISMNEVDVMDKLKEQYFIYRVFNLKTGHPEVFVLDYNDFKDKIDLSVDSYIASIKGE